MKYLILVLLLLTSSWTSADWHKGKITIIAFGYDGQTISIGQEGFTKSDCTCYTTWSNRYCLDIDRETFDKEYAFLLSAKARDKLVAINIDESTCKVTAMYEA